MKGTIVGRLGRDPEKKMSQGGNEYVSFSMAENHYNGQTQQREGLWWNCTAFGKTGDNIIKYFRKGSFIIITGEQGLPFIGNSGAVQEKMTVTSFDFPPKGTNASADGEASGPDLPADTGSDMEDPFGM